MAHSTKVFRPTFVVPTDAVIVRSATLYLHGETVGVQLQHLTERGLFRATDIDPTLMLAALIVVSALDPARPGYTIEEILDDLALLCYVILSDSDQDFIRQVVKVPAAGGGDHRGKGGDNRRTV